MPIPPTHPAKTHGASRDRQRRLLTALMDAGEVGLTRTQMRRLFDGQVRAVERALKALQAGGALITSGFPPDGSREKRFILAVPPEDEACPTPEGILAHHVADETLRRTGGEAWGELNPSKPLAVEPGLGPKAAQKLARVLQGTAVRGTTTSCTGLKEAILPVLVRALAEPILPRLEVAYRAPGREADRMHHVVPHVIVQDAFAGAPYLVGWDVAHHRVAIYRLSRMTSVRPVGHAGLSDDARKALAQTAQNLIGAWATADEPMRVKVRVLDARWARHFQETTPDLPSVQVEKDPRHPEVVVVTFSAAAPEGATRWILQMGGAAEVLEPPEIREAVIRELSRAARRYRKAMAPSAHSQVARR